MPETSPSGVRTTDRTDGRIATVDRCPSCGSRRQTEVREQPDGLFPTGKLRIVTCTDCGLVFLNPRMTEEAMAQLEDVSEVYVMDAATTEREIVARVELLRTLLARTPGSGRLLDVGCNRGLLLRAAQRFGWDAVGVEVSSVTAAIARREAGVPVYADLADVPRDSGFQLVVAWHVLEHTTDPVAFLAQVGKLLSDNGLLAVQVPSYDFADEFVARGMLGSLVCAVHTTYFTDTSLVGALRRAGLEVTGIVNSPDDLMLTAFAKAAVTPRDDGGADHEVALRARIEEFERRSAQTDREVALAARLDELERRLDELLTSRSWRVTAPLRLIGARVRRLVALRRLLWRR
jgi:SAM-dependent methyltransferase